MVGVALNWVLNMSMNPQMQAAMLCLTFYSIVILLVRPYLRKGDDRLALLVNTELFLYISAGYIALSMLWWMMLMVMMMVATVVMVVMVVLLRLIGDLHIIYWYWSWMANHCKHGWVDKYFAFCHDDWPHHFRGGGILVYDFQNCGQDVSKKRVSRVITCGTW